MSHPNAASRPPELIPLGDGVSLQRRSPVHAAGLNAAVASNLDHLRPWMPWAKSAPSMDESIELTRNGIAAWEAGTDFLYVLALDDQPGSAIGGLGLHDRAGAGALEIGYWVHADYTGRGLATASARALAEAALSLDGIERVEIHCDEANAASAAIPAKLGFRLDRVNERAATAPAETGRIQVWILERTA